MPRPDRRPAPARALPREHPRDLRKEPAASGARPVKRSFRIAGHPTSISLEAAFWSALKAAAARRGVPLARLVAEIDAARGDTNLSSAVRVWLLSDLEARLRDGA